MTIPAQNVHGVFEAFVASIPIFSELVVLKPLQGQGGIQKTSRAGSENSHSEYWTQHWEADGHLISLELDANYYSQGGECANAGVSLTWETRTKNGQPELQGRVSARENGEVVSELQARFKPQVPQEKVDAVLTWLQRSLKAKVTRTPGR